MLRGGGGGGVAGHISILLLQAALIRDARRVKGYDNTATCILTLKRADHYFRPRVWNFSLLIYESVLCCVSRFDLWNRFGPMWCSHFLCQRLLNIFFHCCCSFFSFSCQELDEEILKTPKVLYITWDAEDFVFYFQTEQQQMLPPPGPSGVKLFSCSSFMLNKPKERDIDLFQLTLSTK